MRNLIQAGAFALCLSLTSLANAQSGSEGVFTIYNNTTSNVVVGFYTNDGAGWSSNWLEQEIMPDDFAEAAFYAESGSCDQTFQVGWLGDGNSEVLDDPIAIDICDASNVYLDDNEIYYDQPIETKQQVSLETSGTDASSSGSSADIDVSGAIQAMQTVSQ